MSSTRVVQMRLVVEAVDYAAAVAFYRDVLGAPVKLVVDSDGGASVTILDVGRATLELSTRAGGDDRRRQVGRPVRPRLRVAFEVTDAEAVTHDLVAAGAELIAPPTLTPWQSLNARLAAPADLQITVFQEPAILRGSDKPAERTGCRMRIFRSTDELTDAVGETLGSSDWLVVDQERISAFAECTERPPVDPRRRGASCCRTVRWDHRTRLPDVVVGPTLGQQVFGVRDAGGTAQLRPQQGAVPVARPGAGPGSWNGDCAGGDPDAGRFPGRGPAPWSRSRDPTALRASQTASMLLP